MEEGKEEMQNRGRGPAGSFLPRYSPYRVQGTALGTGQVTEPLQMEGFSKRREVQFKFLKLTLDGVRLSQEEVRLERKS